MGVLAILRKFFMKQYRVVVALVANKAIQKSDIKAATFLSSKMLKRHEVVIKTSLERGR